VLELADSLDLGSSGASRGGSNPPFPIDFSTEIEKDWKFESSPFFCLGLFIPSGSS
jgi:hypothetical protein